MQKKTWKQSLYKYGDCNSELPAHKYDTTKLRQWEETSTLWELRCRHKEECEGNEMQLVRCDEAFARFQSCKAKSKKLLNTALQGLGLSQMLLVRHYSDAAEAETIYVSCLSIPTLFLRSPETTVDAKSRDGEADLAMRSVQTVNTFVQSGMPRPR